MEMSSSKSLLESPLTEAGALVGTPPYMAPEQHQGKSDARSDQFSFCVTFWYALYGERPFSGLNFDDLKDNMAQGRVRPPPSGRRAPAWVHKILLRGILPHPEDRFPSMDALLEALAQDPEARRRRLGLAAGVALMAALGAFGWWRSLHGPRACGDAERRLAGVWDDARKQLVRSAFAATGKPFAGDAWRAVERSFDGWARDFVAMHNDACEATRVRGEQSAELLDLRMECLGGRLDELRAQVEVLGTADAEVVEHAAAVAHALSPVAGCADVAALRKKLRCASGPPTRAHPPPRGRALRRELARVRALWQAGRYAPAEKPAAEAVREAQSIGYRPVEGEALLLRGRVEDATGRYPAAERSLRDARVAADAGRADETAALATTGLLWVVGVREGRYAEARELGQGSAGQDRAARARPIVGRAAARRAGVEALVGRAGGRQVRRGARPRRPRRRAARESRCPPASRRWPRALGDRADVLQQLGRYDAAIADYRRALAIGESTLGREHPMVASLLVNYGDALESQNKTDEALAHIRRAEQVAEHALGPLHPMLATISIDLGNLLEAAKHDLDGAVAEYRRARAIWTAALGADSPNVGTCDFRLGEVAMQRGHPDEAEALFQRALDSWEKKLGSDHPSLSAALNGLGDALLAEHHPAQAAERLSARARPAGEIGRTVAPRHHPHARRARASPKSRSALRVLHMNLGEDPPACIRANTR